MKIQKFNESKIIPSNDEELRCMIEDIIQGNVSLRMERYSDDYEINPNSVEEAAKKIIEELKQIGIDFDLLYSTKKYNL